jgi:hypothetical protein
MKYMSNSIHDQLMHDKRTLKTLQIIMIIIIIIIIII